MRIDRIESVSMRVSGGMLDCAAPISYGMHETRGIAYVLKLKKKFRRQFLTCLCCNLALLWQLRSDGFEG